MVRKMIYFQRKENVCFLFLYRVDELKDRINEPIDAFTKLDYS